MVPLRSDATIGGPWAPAGVLEVESIQPWALWLDGRRAGPRRGF
jgi:hypothetical protein